MSPRPSVLLALVALVALAGCAAKASTGAFAHVGRIGTELQRGVSTKMDVRRVLGAPSGVGGALLPTESRPREVWYYADIAMTGMKFEGPGLIRADSRQQVILIMFDRETFDGFVWYGGSGVVQSKSK